MARAFRVDKLTLAAFEATLLAADTPTAAALHADPDRLRARAETVASALSGRAPVEVVPSAGAVGGGGAPGLELPGWAVALPETCAAALRAGEPPVVGRVENGRCLLDLRCVPEDEDEHLIAAVRAVL
jgi:L-seryl-tRNA(Ser) seleniumtransferase